MLYTVRVLHKSHVEFLTKEDYNLKALLILQPNNLYTSVPSKNFIILIALFSFLVREES